MDRCLRALKPAPATQDTRAAKLRQAAAAPVEFHRSAKPLLQPVQIHGLAGPTLPRHAARLAGMAAQGLRQQRVDLRAPGHAPPGSLQIAQQPPDRAHTKVEPQPLPGSPGPQHRPAFQARQRQHAEIPRPGADFRRDPQALRILRGIQVGTPGAPSGRGRQPEAVRGARPEGLGQQMVERTPLVEGFAPPPNPRSPAQPAERAGPQQNAHPVCCFSLP